MCGLRFQQRSLRGVGRDVVGRNIGVKTKEDEEQCNKKKIEGMWSLNEAPDESHIGRKEMQRRKERDHRSRIFKHSF
jgi:hypothetical protein